MEIECELLNEDTLILRVLDKIGRDWGYESTIYKRFEKAING